MSNESSRLEVHFDTLKEISNIGTGHAVTALSQLLQRNFRMSVPTVNFVEFKDVANFVGGPEALILAVLVNISGDMNGIVMFMVKQDSAHNLINILLGSTTNAYEDENSFSELELSTLTEVGNILVSSYLGSLAAMINKKIVPSVPQLAADMANAVLSVPAIEFGRVADKALFIESLFGTEEENVKGYFIFVPEMESFERSFKF
ncbi:MAG: chemotaxis protein CheC [Defluviitaleaceae bacterium]|nr:chemotaxis protein CheC [Defluviitaleaceae bacterium]